MFLQNLTVPSKPQEMRMPSSLQKCRSRCMYVHACRIQFSHAGHCFALPSLSTIRTNLVEWVLYLDHYVALQFSSDSVACEKAICYYVKSKYNSERVGHP